MFESGDIIQFTNTNEFCEIKMVRIGDNVYELAVLNHSITYFTAIDNPQLRLASKQERHNYLLFKFNNAVEN